MELGPGTFYGAAEGLCSSGVATLAETSYDTGFAVPNHTHRTGFFCLVVEGHLEERFGGENERLGRGDVLFHPAEAAHAEAFPHGPARVFNIQPHTGWLCRLQNFELEPLDEQVTVGSTSRLSWLALQIRQEWRRGDALAPLAIEGLLIEALVALFRNSPPGADRGRPAWLLEVRDALHASFDESVRLADLAMMVEVDPAHLSRTFRRHFGCPPGEYVRRLRVEKARRALEETDESLAEVAFGAGFTDQSHFTRTFRRYVGTTPGVYRTQFREPACDDEKNSGEGDSQAPAIEDP